MQNWEGSWISTEDLEVPAIHENININHHGSEMSSNWAGDKYKVILKEFLVFLVLISSVN